MQRAQGPQSAHECARCGATGRFALGYFRTSRALSNTRVSAANETAPGGTAAGAPSTISWSNSKVRDQTWAYGHFMITPWADEKMAIGGELIPIRKTVGASPAFKNLPPKLSHLKLLSEAVGEWGYQEFSPPIPYGPHLLLAFHRIVTENVAVDKGLQDAANEYNKQLAESKKK